MARHLIMSGIPLELKLRLISWKLLIIGRVMTSLIVRTFKIGQSAGKVPESAMARIWYSLRDLYHQKQLEYFQHLLGIDWRCPKDVKNTL